MIKVILAENAALPTAKPGDGWWDLSSAREVVIPSQGVVRVSTGLRFELPCKASIYGRSGLASRSRWPEGGRIDRGYRGVWEVVLVNFSVVPWHIRMGERIAQFEFEDKALNPDHWWDEMGHWSETGDPISPFVVVESFETETDRGEKGFGSSGA
jgi:deoxyuridine 5'-triphosphate nucleotidohydrolase